jgi:hypothetical protein
MRDQNLGGSFDGVYIGLPLPIIGDAYRPPLSPAQHAAQRALLIPKRTFSAYLLQSRPSRLMAVQHPLHTEAIRQFSVVVAPWLHTECGCNETSWVLVQIGSANRLK